MTNLTRLNDLLELRNSLVNADDRIDWYDMMDAMNTEEEASEDLVQEIYRLLDALMEKVPAAVARLREDLNRIINE